MTRRARIAVFVLMAFAAAGLGTLGVLRYVTFHNETFDLAFYARMAWGLVRGSFWEPIVGAHVLGVHVSPVVVPLGALGALTGDTAIVLVVAQALALALTAWPLARVGARRFGHAGALFGALAWLLYPNVAHVASYEMHPGTLAVLPLAWALDAFDRGHAQHFAIAVASVLLCREDLGLVTGLLAVLAWRAKPIELGRSGKGLAALSFAWVGLFVLVFHPMFAPETGSLELHFGKWGGSVGAVAVAVLTRPLDVLEHLGTVARSTYAVRALAPLALLPLFAPRLLLPVVPILGINLMSEWPTTTSLDSHYHTTMLPFLVAAAIEGAAWLEARFSRRIARAALAVGLACGATAHAIAGGTPLSRDFEATAFVHDARSAHAARVVAEIPDEVSVQAPYALMPHLAERKRFGPAPPPDRDTDHVVIDGWHREAHAHRETLIRTTEEPTLRDWLARRDYGLVSVHGPYFHFVRGASTRDEVGGPYLRGTTDDPDAGVRVAACLGLVAARREGDALVLELAARGACPADLAVRIGTGHRPRRVDLLCDGVLSPALFERGDLIRSRHRLSAAEWALAAHKPLRVGLLRQSGARPEHADPVAVDLVLAR